MLYCTKSIVIKFLFFSFLAGLNGHGGYAHHPADSRPPVGASAASGGIFLSKLTDLLTQIVSQTRQ